MVLAAAPPASAAHINVPPTASARSLPHEVASMASSAHESASAPKIARPQYSSTTIASGEITGYEGLCLDDSGANTSPGNPVDVYTCNNTDAQDWTVESNQTLEVLGMCLDLTGGVPAAGATTNGITVEINTCDGSDSQLWLPESNGSLFNPASGDCLDDTNYSTTPGTQAQIWSCTGNANQDWTLPAASPGPPTGPIGGYDSLCLDDLGAGTTDDNPIDVYTCNGTAAQSWSVESNNTLQVLGMCLGVKDGGTAAGTTVDLYTCNNTAGQVWEQQSNGELLNPQSGDCLDDTDYATTPGTQAQIWTCTGDADEIWDLPSGLPSVSNPGLGPNVTLFTPNMSSSTIQDEVDTLYAQQESNQFGTGRYALLFAPGTYNIAIPVGFYTQVIGLGSSPSDTTITGGGVYADAAWNNSPNPGNATENFWRGAENITIDPASGTTEWAVSQASPLRDVQVEGNLLLADNSGWASGGYLGNSVVTGQVNSSTQQQWLSRNDQIGSWTGSNWNMVFVGDEGAPAQSFPSPPYTTVAQTPAIAEAPYLYVDQAGDFNVFVPGDETDVQGTTWEDTGQSGTSLPLSDFYIATPSSTVAEINSALASGDDLLFTPGVYQIDGTIQVNNPGTVILGLGLATLVSNDGDTILSTADVNGIRISGLIFDAGTTNSNTLVQIGPPGSDADHSSDPTVLSDVFARIGGATVGEATQTLQINSNNVIGDDLWLWRADHGNAGTVGWTVNTATNGLVVNGNNVTMYGLAVEHYQGVQTEWNGNDGSDYFYQSEMPYDPPSQSAWMDGSSDGYPSIQVASNVTSFQAYGLGTYCNFDVDPSIIGANAYVVPDVSGVQFNDMVSVSLGGIGTIENIINGVGVTVDSSNTTAYLTSYNG
jgi:hypothetical protein